MFFTAKLASLFLTVAAVAQASVVTRNELAALSVIFFDDVGFAGAAFIPPDLTTNKCITLPESFKDRAESLIIGEGYACIFFTTSTCEGFNTPLHGSVSNIPPPFYNNIESFFCTKSS